MKTLAALLLLLTSGCAVLYVDVHTEDHVHVEKPSVEFNR